jgi:S-DNA-T family DNA segregation ATPase FtsK/SpoIIIE
MLDGIRIPARGIDLGEWRRAMREGRCEVHLKGLSHVFVPTSSDVDDPTIATEVADARYAYQEIIGRKALKQLLMAYWHDQSTADVRRGMGFYHMDFEPTWRAPGSGVAFLRSAYRTPVLRPASTPAFPVPDAPPDTPAECRRNRASKNCSTRRPPAIACRCPLILRRRRRGRKLSGPIRRSPI